MFTCVDDTRRLRKNDPFREEAVRDFAVDAPGVVRRRNLRNRTGKDQ